MLRADIGRDLTALVVGAHADDIEIGCGASLLHWIQAGTLARVHWMVLSGASTSRESEARTAARAFLGGLDSDACRVEIEGFRDGFFPYEGAAVKEHFEGLKVRLHPDLILTPARDDRHQDHRLTCELTWNTFRDHLILEYEIPKFEGELGQPNVFVELPPWAVERKAELIVEHFQSQADRAWFGPETFRALARLRGIEARADSGYAEGYYVRKLRV